MYMLKRSNLHDVFIKYIVAAILIVVPLYPKFPFLKIPGTFVSVRLEDLIFLLSGFLLISIHLPRLREFFKSKLNLAVVLYLSIGLLSLFSAVFLTQSVVIQIGFLHWARRIEYFIPLFLGFESIKRNKLNLDFYLKIIVLVVFFIFIYGYGQKHYGWPIIITQNEEYSKGVALRWIPGSHINSTFAGHYDLASYLVLIMPIFISLIFILKNRMEKATIIVLVIAGLWLLVNSASRISLISYLISSSFALILIKKIKVIPILFVVTVVFVIFSSNLLDRYLRIFKVLRDDFVQFNRINYQLSATQIYASDDFSARVNTLSPTPTPIPVFEDRSTNIRLNVEWPRAFRALTKNPLLGTGYSSITLATDNDYFRLLGETGILGFTSFIGIFLVIIYFYFKVVPFNKQFNGIERAFLAGIIGALPGIFINAFFIDIFEASKFALIFWLLIGMSISLIKK